MPEYLPGRTGPIRISVDVDVKWQTLAEVMGLSASIITCGDDGVTIEDPPPDRFYRVLTGETL
jgi:hypothetical protein